MAVESFSNNASTTLSAAMTDTIGTSMSVTSATGFPSSGQYRIKVDSELFVVTGGQGTTTWTVTRGAESSTAATHSNGAAVTHVLTAASLARVVEGRAVVASADASYDFSSATGLWLPQSAGAAPANTGQIAHDTTKRMLKTRDAVFGVSALVESLGAQYANADTLSAATITTTETAFATTLVLPASYFVLNKTIWLFAAFQFTSSASPPTLNLRLRTGTVGAGTVLWTTAAMTQLTGKTNWNFAEFFSIQGTAAPGGAVALETDFVQAYLGGSFIGPGTTAQPVTVATNAGITLTLTAQFGASTAGNTVSLRQLAAVEVN